MQVDTPQQVVIVRQTQVAPPDHMMTAIVVTLCCCCPIGLVAAIKANEVSTSQPVTYDVKFDLIYCIRELPCLPVFSDSIKSFKCCQIGFVTTNVETLL